MNSYERFHRNPLNLVIHVFAVPLFAVCLVGSVWALLLGSIVTAVLLLLVPVLSLGVQGFGHKLEEVPPEPFTGPANFVSRILMEQFYRFWVFLFSGGWYRALTSRKIRSGTR